MGWKVVRSMDDVVARVISGWMKGRGPEDDVVLGSRIRLARNLDGIPFPAVAGEANLKKVVDMVSHVVRRWSASGLQFMHMADIPAIERHLLVEKHLISPDHAQNVKAKAVVLRNDEMISVMVNEEDHLRIQAIFPGLQLEKAWEEAGRIDDALGAELDFAYSREKGYLTACPTNVGTGMRASLMLHLPALVAQNSLPRVVAAVNKLGLAVRGLYGEGTEAFGNIFQVSNQVTLGRSEEEIIGHLSNVVQQIIGQERKTREKMVSTAKLQISDQVHRALGILTHARILDTKEAMELLSRVRMGIDLGLIDEIPPQILQELMVLIRPAHLQKVMGHDMEAASRDQYRATLIRERLKRRGKGMENQ